MIEERKVRWISRRVDRLDAFKGDSSAMKLKALRIIERNTTTRHALTVLGVAVPALLNYWPVVAGWFRVTF